MAKTLLSIVLMAVAAAAMMGQGALPIVQAVSRKGDTVTLRGFNFGEEQGSVFVKYKKAGVARERSQPIAATGNTAPLAGILTWQNDVIVVKLPQAVADKIASMGESKPVQGAAGNQAAATSEYAVRLPDGTESAWQALLPFAIK